MQRSLIAFAGRTNHDRDEVVVMPADEFRRLKGSMTGKALIEAMQASPYREIELDPSTGGATTLRRKGNDPEVRVIVRVLTAERSDEPVRLLA